MPSSRQRVPCLVLKPHKSWDSEVFFPFMVGKCEASTQSAGLLGPHMRSETMLISILLCGFVAG